MRIARGRPSRARRFEKSREYFRTVETKPETPGKQAKLNNAFIKISSVGHKISKTLRVYARTIEIESGFHIFPPRCAKREIDG